MAPAKVVDYEVVLRINGWCACYEQSLRSGILLALARNGYPEERVEVVSVSELARRPSIAGPITAPTGNTPLSEGSEERKSR